MIEVLQIVTVEHFFSEPSPRLVCKFAHHCHSNCAKTLAELSVKCEEERKTKLEGGGGRERRLPRFLFDVVR